MLAQRRLVLIACIALLCLPVVMAGCQSPAGAHEAAADGSQHGQCLVCKHNADLACVDVKINDKTPKTTYQGRTYYFCSDECKAEFEKNPGKFAGR